MIRMSIGAYALPVMASFDLTQRYEEFGPENVLRTASGRGIKQMTWRKRRIVTQGSGWVPAGLHAIDFTAQHQVGCVLAVSLPADFTTRQVTLPAARRSDPDGMPFGQAELPGGQMVNTPLVMAGDVATLTAVSDAVRYQVGYFPMLLCWVFRPTLSGPEGYGWELIAEEV